MIAASSSLRYLRTWREPLALGADVGQTEEIDLERWREMAVGSVHDVELAERDGFDTPGAHYFTEAF